MTALFTALEEGSQRGFRRGPVAESVPAGAGDMELTPGPEDPMCLGAAGPMCPDD